MFGATMTPSGSRRPPISTPRLSSRATIGSTGRIRSVSLHTASAYSVPASWASVTSCSIASGWRTSRSIAQASDVAVVSWPASSNVISSSRSSSSLIDEPSSWRACSSSDRMSSRSSRSVRVRA